MATTTTTKAQKSSTHRSPQGYTNNDTTLNETQRKYKDTHRGLMCPTGPALSHPAAPMLKKFATEGYPTESTYEWNLAELDDAVEMGPPPVSTRDRRSKSLQKGSIGKSGARFLQPDTVENTSETFPDVLKVHPIAAIEHKSRSYRMILNVSKGGRGRHKDRPSLNESTVQEAAPLHSMQQLGTPPPPNRGHRVKNLTI